jgi:outer membrane protein
MPNFRMVYFACALAVALSSGVAQAQKFAIINMQQAVLSTNDGKKAAAVIDAKFAPVKADIEQLQKNITAKQTEFMQNRATLTPAAVTAAQAEIESLTTLLKRKQEDAQQDLQEDESKQLGAIVPKLQQVINSYATANQINLVVDTSASPNNLIYGDGSLNITGAIVAAYEKATAPPPAPSPAPAATTPKTPAAPKPAATPAK